ncbi:unnamed protein product [Amoebophrya sp. A120]|nr:unnamed protein product [Amoebophrya sp. A120]|eukprot:GSA120T00010350001.1
MTNSPASGRDRKLCPTICPSRGSASSCSPAKKATTSPPIRASPKPQKDHNDSTMAAVDSTEEDLREKQESALRENIRTKGTNAYYYAHNRKFEVPADAIIRSGPGIITGGAPVPLDKPDFDCSLTTVDGGSTRLPKVPPGSVKVDKYLLVDENEKIQVIVDFNEILKSEAARQNLSLDSVEFEMSNESSFTLVCFTSDKLDETGKQTAYALTCDNLKHDVVAEKCKHRVNKDKKKVTVNLVKQIAQKWGQLSSTGK